MAWTSCSVLSSFSSSIQPLSDAVHGLKARWFDIGGLTVNYSIGLDGISFLLVELTLLLDLWSSSPPGLRFKKGEGIPHPHAHPPNGHDRRIRGPGLFSSSTCSGADADPDVFPDRHLGRGTQDLRSPQVLPFTMAGSVLMLVAIVYV